MITLKDILKGKQLPLQLSFVGSNYFKMYVSYIDQLENITFTCAKGSIPNTNHSKVLTFVPDDYSKYLRNIYIELDNKSHTISNAYVVTETSTHKINLAIYMSQANAQKLCNLLNKSLIVLK